MRELKTTVAQPFKIRGKGRLTPSEFVFALNLDLGWFTPEEAKEVLKLAKSAGLLAEKEGRLIPLFSIGVIDVPDGFRPGPEVLKPKTLMEKVTGLLADRGYNNGEIRALIDSKVERCCGLIYPEVAGLIAAKEKGINIDGLLDETYDEVRRR